jgi:hypothetical protein
MVREDACFQNMTDKDEEALITEFEARPDKKVVGTRLSNAAAARDVTAFTKRVHHEVSGATNCEAGITDLLSALQPPEAHWGDRGLRYRTV